MCFLQPFRRPAPLILSLDNNIIPVLDFLDTCSGVRSYMLLCNHPGVLFGSIERMHANKSFFLGKSLDN